MNEQLGAGIRFPAQKKQAPLWKEVDTVTDSELREKLIQQFTDLHRIKIAADMAREVDYQIKSVKAKLEAIGVATENLEVY